MICEGTDLSQHAHRNVAGKLDHFHQGQGFEHQTCHPFICKETSHDKACNTVYYAMSGGY